MLPMFPHPYALCREMKLTSPRLNLVIAVGAIVWYISVAVKAIPTEDITTATVLCEVSRQAEFTVVAVKLRYGHGLQLFHSNCAISINATLVHSCILKQLETSHPRML